MTTRKQDQHDSKPTPPSRDFMHMMNPGPPNRPDEIARVRDLISHQPDTEHLAQILGIPLDL